MRQGVKTGRSKLFKEVRALDGTRKFLLQLHDGYLVETVGIPLDDIDKQRLTVCVSSQVHRALPALHHRFRHWRLATSKQWFELDAILKKQACD